MRYTVNDFKKGDKIKTIHGRIYEVDRCDMMPYPVILGSDRMLPVPAIVTTDGRYFILSVSGIEKHIEEHDLNRN